MTTDAAGDGTNTPEMTSAGVLDVRPDVELGGEPFLRVLAYAESTAAGEAFIVIAPFELLAIYPTLAARGFCYQTEHVGPAEWLTRFTRQRTPASGSIPPVQEARPDE